MRRVYRYIKLLLALFIAAFSFNLFLLPTKIVSGGVNGIALVINNRFNIDPSISIFIISIVCLILGFIFLEKEKVYSSVFATVMYPIFVKVTFPLANMIKLDLNDMIIISIIVGIISGITNGIIYKNGFNNGSIGIINQIIYKYFKIPISKTSFFINGLIILLGGAYFGFTIVMYAIIIIFINSVILDKVLLGLSSKKSFYIISEKSFEIERFIIDELNHGVTIFNAKGGFLFKNKKMLLAVVPSREYFYLTEGIKEIDKDAFFVAANTYEVYGEK